MYNHYVYYESHSIARKQDAAAYKSTIMYTCMQNTTTLCYVFKHKQKQTYSAKFTQHINVDTLEDSDLIFGKLLPSSRRP